MASKLIRLEPRVGTLLLYAMLASLVLGQVAAAQTSPRSVSNPAKISPAKISGPKYFGFYSTGKYSIEKSDDDPENVIVKSFEFSNTAFAHPQYISDFNSRGIKPIVYLGEWPMKGSDWKRFRKLYRAKISPASITALYFTDEPTWNGFTQAQIQTAAVRVKAAFPTIPLLLVEAVPGLGQQEGCVAPFDGRARSLGGTAMSRCVEPLTIPPQVDWVGFDMYGVRNPRKDSNQFMHYYNLLKSKRSKSSQKLVVVMDAWWVPGHHDVRGLSPEMMQTVAKNYYRVAKADPEVIAILGWAWAPVGAFEGGRKDILYAPQLPETVIEEYRKIGRRISRKSATAEP